MTDRTGERPGRGVLDRARIIARLTPHELWLQYLGLGGDVGPREVGSYLSGATDPSRWDYNLLVDALNERLADVGLAASVRYAT